MLILPEIATPIGPVGVICIRRSLAQGAKYGFISGLGAATADAIYGCVAAFGFAWLTSLLIGYQGKACLQLIPLYLQLQSQIP